MLKNALKFILLFIAFLCIFFVGRKVLFDGQQESLDSLVSQDKSEQSLPDDFHSFYDKFHTDSTFQLERIIFPLKGMGKASDTSSTIEEITWQQEEWKIHGPFNNQNGTFERVFTNVAGIVTEYIASTNGLFSMEKRYAKLGGEWHLIYYQGLEMN